MTCHLDAGNIAIGANTHNQGQCAAKALRVDLYAVADGNIAGIKVTGHAETPGLGAKAQTDSAWVAQYQGAAADGQLMVTKDGGTINAITGATITSRAVTDGVNTAAAYIATLG